jgi:hypothetical protein
LRHRQRITGAEVSVLINEPDNRLAQECETYSGGNIHNQDQAKTFSVVVCHCRKVSFRCMARDQGINDGANRHRENPDRQLHQSVRVKEERCGRVVDRERNEPRDVNIDLIYRRAEQTGRHQHANFPNAG